MNSPKAAVAGKTFADRLAERLDREGIGLDRLRADFPGWRIWCSRRTGRVHACRHIAASGGFTEREGDPRRFHVAAVTPGRLAVLLLAQTALDAGHPGG